MKENFSYRLKKAMQIRNMKATELSEKAHIPKSAISQYLSGLYEAKQKSIFKLANVLNISEAWLMGLDVPMEETITEESENPIVSIPILKTIKAGYDYMAQENWEGTIDVDKELIQDTSEYFALKVKGDSMFPVLIENDIVIIKKQDDFENGDLVVAIINGDEATIKKGKKSNNNILLQPLNTNYEPLIFTYDQIKTIPITILGIVKQLKREF